MKSSQMLDFYSNSKCFKLTAEMIKDDFSLVVGNIDLPITTKCSLNCKYCSSLMPRYKEPSNFDIDEIKRELYRFFECIDLVVRVNVLGGEPFLFPNLADVLQVLNYSNKVHHVVIITNGTIVPSDEKLFNALKNEKIEVRISSYPKEINKASKLCDKLMKNGVKYTIKRFGKNDFTWYDYGEFFDRNSDEKSLDAQYENCDVEWHSLLHGKLYPCPRAAHASDLGLIPDDNRNYVDLFDETKSIDELKSELEKFIFVTKHFEACRFCDRGTEFCKEVVVAEQVTENE